MPVKQAPRGGSADSPRFRWKLLEKFDPYFGVADDAPTSRLHP
jgi:hypothetical protein